MLSRRPSGLNVAIAYRQSTGALHLLIDSTGSRVGDVEPVRATGSSELARDTARTVEPDPR